MYLRITLSLFLLVTVTQTAPTGQDLSNVYCHVCVDAVDNRDCNATTLCDSDHPICLTTLVFDEGEVSIDKRCARRQVCLTREENNEDSCYDADEEFEGICHYCCEGAGCNKLLPSYSRQYDQAEQRQPENRAGRNTHNSKTSRPTNSKTSRPRNSKTSRPKTSRTSRPKTSRTSRPKTSKTSQPKRTTHSRVTQKALTTSRRTRQPQTNPPTTQPPQTNPPTTQPPQTNPPNTQPPQSTQQPTTVQPSQAPSAVQCPVHNNVVSSPGSILFPGIKISINLELGGNGISVSQPQTPTCTCQQPATQGSKVVSTAAPSTSGPMTTGTSTSAVTSGTTTSNPVTTANVTSSPLTSVNSTASAQNQTTSAANVTTVAMTTNTTGNGSVSSNNTTSSAMSTNSTSATTATTSGTTTTTTSTTTTTTPAGHQCFTCDNADCSQQTLQVCSYTEKFCMNTITQDIQGARTFQKGCANRLTCLDKWWQNTAGLADYFLLSNNPQGPPGLALNACSFCCTGTGCNQNAIPDMTTLFQP